MSNPAFCAACGGPLIDREIARIMRRVCNVCDRITYRNPAPAAGCIVVQRRPGDKMPCVLLALRKFEPWKDHWYIPSGFVEYGEDVETTAQRELEEETGLVVALGPIFGIYSYFDDPRQHGIIMLYRATVTGGTLQAGDDASDVAFFAADELPPMEQIGFATHRRALSEWRAEVLQQMAASGPERSRDQPMRATVQDDRADAAT